jgi:hypothetical protein
MKILIFVALVFIAYSCSKSESEYNIKYWEHESRMLDLIYLERLNTLDVNYKNKQIRLEIDSLINNSI